MDGWREETKIEKDVEGNQLGWGKGRGKGKGKGKGGGRRKGGGLFCFVLFYTFLHHLNAQYLTLPYLPPSISNFYHHSYFTCCFIVFCVPLEFSFWGGSLGCLRLVNGKTKVYTKDYGNHRSEIEGRLKKKSY